MHTTKADIKKKQQIITRLGKILFFIHLSIFIFAIILIVLMFYK